MQRSTKPTDASQPPIYLNTAATAALLGVSRDTLKKWRLGDKKKIKPTPPKLIENVHWVYISPSDVRYNRELMRDFMANLGRPDLHQKAIEKFLADLPSSRAAGD